MSGLRDFTDELIAKTTLGEDRERVFVTEEKAMP